MVECQRCGGTIRSLNKLRKWCVDCRYALTNERARERNRARRQQRKGGKILSQTI
ncbi:TPA: hypothetical protein HA249_06235 [Candidatus Woesearchaeota archaeon]|nr:hypothetical protein [Candidatus Woesearchaeota archaeon]HIH47768.1 hypothetical protein [Candidatus Woesearchaeota archaeon]HII88431.1 hypothetical protein [Candidatus Woesearchaeota archaeon]